MPPPNYLIECFKKVQESSSTFRKSLQLLENRYFKEENKEAFLENILLISRNLLAQQFANANPHVDRCLKFCAKLCVDLAKKETVDISKDAFLNKVWKETLMCVAHADPNIRFNSCYFITLLLKNLGGDVQLENEIWDSTQEIILARFNDRHTLVRLEALRALERLQEPGNPDCPVTHAYVTLLNDAKIAVRKESVRLICLTGATLLKLKLKVVDPDPGVRQAAFARCADTSPVHFTIANRLFILRHGFTESVERTKRVFLEKLLPKWFSCSNGNYLKFLNWMSMDADENDLQTSADVMANIIKGFLRSHSLEDMIKALPITDMNVIEPKDLSIEVVILWSILTKHLRTNNLDETLETVLPELTGFCNYLERVITEKDDERLEDWEILQNQFIILNLLDMVSDFDMSDEVGRRTFYALVFRMLTRHKFSAKVTNKFILLASKINTNVDTFTNDLCQVISDIKEPLEVECLSEAEIKARKFKIAETKVRCTQLQVDKESALEKKDYLTVQCIVNELEAVQRELQELENEVQAPEKVQETKDDTELALRCLDLLIGLLKVPTITSMSPSLMSCKEEFLTPLLTNNSAEIHAKGLECLSLFGLIDKDIALENIKILSFPIATYHASLNIDELPIEAAVNGVTDLLRVYDLDMLGLEKKLEESATSNNSTKRKLYNNGELDEVSIISEFKMTMENVIDVILDMMDDKESKIREFAFNSIARFLLDKKFGSTQIIYRVIVKWLQSTKAENNDVNLQHKLGYLIKYYTEKVPDSKSTLADAALLFISSLGNVTKAKNISVLDHDNALKLFATLTTGIQDNQLVHQKVAKGLLEKLESKPNELTLCFASKLLSHLDVYNKDESLSYGDDMIEPVEALIDELQVVNKAVAKNLSKFLNKLKKKALDVTIITTNNSDVTSTTDQTKDPTALESMTDQTKDTTSIAQHSDAMHASSSLKIGQKRDLLISNNNLIPDDPNVIKKPRIAEKQPIVIHSNVTITGPNDDKNQNKQNGLKTPFSTCGENPRNNNHEICDKGTKQLFVKISPRSTLRQSFMQRFGQKSSELSISETSSSSDSVISATPPEQSAKNDGEILIRNYKTATPSRSLFTIVNSLSSEHSQTNELRNRIVSLLEMGESSSVKSTKKNQAAKNLDLERIVENKDSSPVDRGSRNDSKKINVEENISGTNTRTNSNKTDQVNTTSEGMKNVEEKIPDDSKKNQYDKNKETEKRILEIKRTNTRADLKKRNGMVSEPEEQKSLEEKRDSKKAGREKNKLDETDSNSTPTNSLSSRSFDEESNGNLSKKNLTASVVTNKITTRSGGIRKKFNTSVLSNSTKDSDNRKNKDTNFSRTSPDSRKILRLSNALIKKNNRVVSESSSSDSDSENGEEKIPDDLTKNVPDESSEIIKEMEKKNPETTNRVTRGADLKKRNGIVSGSEKKKNIREKTNQKKINKSRSLDASTSENESKTTPLNSLSSRSSNEGLNRNKIRTRSGGQNALDTSNSSNASDTRKNKVTNVSPDTRKILRLSNESTKKNNRIVSQSSSSEDGEAKTGMKRTSKNSTLKIAKKMSKNESHASISSTTSSSTTKSNQAVNTRTSNLKKTQSTKKALRSLNFHSLLLETKSASRSLINVSLLSDTSEGSEINGRFHSKRVLRTSANGLLVSSGSRTSPSGSSDSTTKENSQANVELKKSRNLRPKKVLSVRQDLFNETTDSSDSAASKRLRSSKSPRESKILLSVRRARQNAIDGLKVRSPTHRADSGLKMSNKANVVLQRDQIESLDTKSNSRLDTVKRTSHRLHLKAHERSLAVKRKKDVASSSDTSFCMSSESNTEVQDNSGDNTDISSKDSNTPESKRKNVAASSKTLRSIKRISTPTVKSLRSSRHKVPKRKFQAIGSPIGSSSRPAKKKHFEEYPL